MKVNRRRVLHGAGLAAAGIALQANGWAWASDAASGAPITTTTAGKIRGVVEDGINVFKGVPYGADTAKRRFMPPVPPEQWTGVKDCTHFTTMAPQLRPPGASSTMHAPTSSSGVPGGPRDEGRQSEDCLHLNVFTPGLCDHKRRPVLVYIHGGAYNNGTVNNGLYDGKRLCHRGDVVVVTVNHRLNAFGYLYLGDLAPEYAESGNVGQLDLVLALRWIRENIAEFGGDPTRVLIFGQSGGGAKCAALMATPVAKGYFNRVMTMSGEQIKGASIPIAIGRAKIVLAKMGIPESMKGKQLIAALNALTMQQIQEGARAVSSDWLPVVDHVVLFRNPFDPDAPRLSEEIPMILGNVRNETGVRAPANLTWAQAPEALERSVDEYMGPVSAEEAIAEIRKAEPNNTPIEVDRTAATAFRGWAPQRMEAEHRATNPISQKRTWVYQMNFPGANGLAGHTLDIPFMFDNIAIDSRQVGAEPEHLKQANALAAIMSQMLITYGRTGSPNGDDPSQKSTQDGKLPYWPTYSLETRATMIWDAKPRIEDDPRRAARIIAEKAHYHQAGTPLP